MAPCPDRECSSDPARPLKGLPIRLWFDNPAYCISPTASAASRTMDSPLPAGDMRRNSSAPNERSDVLSSAVCRRSSLPVTFGRLPATSSERSPDPERPLKGLAIKFWFDNPAYCISPTASAASSPKGCDGVLLWGSPR
ncbi:hypothetical protein T484DRAFT_1946274 [Baffinella frigidus]|jgi:hypothetical protein|nr:hypothetical protein T484DRAFT_1946274 [Cryptophyta sp. CCMP2293]